MQPQNYTAPTYPQGQPQGRILIYWGCGERARPGQPFEIDLARLRPGQMPPAMAQMAIQAMNPPERRHLRHLSANGRTSARSDRVPANGSLVGAHTIRGNYTPEINFSLAAGNDFLAPIAITRNSPAPSRAVPVAWQSVPGARAFFLMAIGAAQDGTIVMWSSSEIQFSQMGVLDYLSRRRDRPAAPAARAAPRRDHPVHGPGRGRGPGPGGVADADRLRRRGQFQHARARPAPAAAGAPTGR